MYSTIRATDSSSKKYSFILFCASLPSSSSPPGLAWSTRAGQTRTRKISISSQGFSLI